MRHERIHRADVEGQLARALAAAARDAGIDASVEHRRSRPWASATFVGTQHALTVVAARTPALDAWLAGLPDAEFTLRGHIVASLAVDAVGDACTDLAVLTLEDG